MSVMPMDAAEIVAERHTGSPGHRLAWLRGRPGAVLGLGWLVLVIVLSTTAPLWRPYPIDDQQLADRFQLPSAAHWLGTDQLGRDLLSRLFTAGAQPLLSSAETVAIAFLIGIPLALLAAERGRRTEAVIGRLAEIVMSLPGLIIILALIGVIGPRTYLVMGVFGLLLSAAVYRILIGVAKAARTRLFVDAARVDGVGPVRVNLVHILPSMATIIAVQAAQLFGISLLIVSGLAFLGFGPAEPQPSWGTMISSASQYVYQDPWLMVPSGVVLALTVVAANELADALAGRPDERRGGARARRTPVRAILPSAIIEHDTDALLSVAGLTVAVDGGPALVTGLSFSLHQGRVLGLVGESGCGKTMTARSLLGLLPDGVGIAGGSIRWDGSELVGLSDAEFNRLRGREIAMISQEPMVALDPMFSIGYQLTGPIRRFRGVGRREARRRAGDLLQQVGIVDAKRVLSSYPHQLSGGMAQRVAIALALTGGPRLLVADEPTTALDVTVQAEILSLLRALVRETGLSIVIVSHDLGVVADICDDVAVMYAGQIVESGPVDAVLGEAEHPYTMALLGADSHVPDGQPVPSRLAFIPGTVPPPESWSAGCRFRDRCRFAREQCAGRFPAIPVHESGTVLCARADELRHSGAAWHAEPAGAELRHRLIETGLSE